MCHLSYIFHRHCFLHKLSGLINYDFLYTRKRFSWDYNDFTLWSIVSMPLSSAGEYLYYIVFLCENVGKNEFTI